MSSIKPPSNTGATNEMGAITWRLPPPPLMRSNTVAAANSSQNNRHPFKRQPQQPLQPVCYKNIAKRVTMQFPHSPDIQLKITYTGSGDVNLNFLPVLWGFIAAVKDLSKQFPNIIQLSEADNVYFPAEVARLKYTTFVLKTNTWTDEAFQGTWLQHIVPAIEENVQRNFSFPDFVVNDVNFEFLPSLVTPDFDRFDGHAFNETELINLFLDEEFEFTYRDEARSIVTVQGVEYHLQFLWLPGTKNRFITISALIQDYKVTAKRLRDVIISRQIPISLREGDAYKGKVQVARRKKGLANYMQEAEERSVECYIGMRYKRAIERDVTVDKFSTHTELTVKSALSANSLQQIQKQRQPTLPRSSKPKKARLVPPVAATKNGTALTKQQ